MSRTSQIDWEEARRFFNALGPTRTQSAVAEKFSVSETIVSRVARRDGWVERARALDARAAAKADERFVADYATRAAKRVGEIDMLCSRLLEDVAAGKVEVKASDYAHLVKLEQLLTGGATDRVELREVREFVNRFVLAVVPFVPKDRRAAFLAALDEVARSMGTLELPAIETSEEPSP